jgi:hypothetical protein
MACGVYMGDKEAEANAVSVRARGKGDPGWIPLEGW